MSLYVWLQKAIQVHWQIVTIMEIIFRYELIIYYLTYSGVWKSETTKVKHIEIDWFPTVRLHCVSHIDYRTSFLLLNVQVNFKSW